MQERPTAQHFGDHSLDVVNGLQRLGQDDASRIVRPSNAPSPLFRSACITSRPRSMHVRTFFSSNSAPTRRRMVPFCEPREQVARPAAEIQDARSGGMSSTIRS